MFLGSLLMPSYHTNRKFGGKKFLSIKKTHNFCPLDCGCPDCAPYCSTAGYCQKTTAAGSTPCATYNNGEECYSLDGCVLQQEPEFLNKKVRILESLELDFTDVYLMRNDFFFFNPAFGELSAFSVKGTGGLFL